MKELVIIVSRKWAEREIKHTVCSDAEGISITCPLEDFITQLTDKILEMSRMDRLRAVPLAQGIRNASLEIVEHMKESTAKA